MDTHLRGVIQGKGKRLEGRSSVAVIYGPAVKSALRKIIGVVIHPVGSFVKARVEK